MIDTQGLRKKILDLAVHGQLVQQLPEYGNAREDFEAWTKATTNKKKLIDGVEPYNIPSNWAWLTVENVIVKSVGGGTPSKNISEYWKDGNIPWASVKDFSDAKNGYLMDTRDHITKEGLENSAANMVDEEAIVICMRMALGKVARVRRPMAINQDLRAIWLSPLVDKDYFVGFYSTLKVEGTGTTVAGIKKDQLFKTPFPLPPISEQHRIVKRMRAAFEMIDFIDSLQKQYADNIASLNTKILDLAVRGKLVPQDPNDEPASVLLKKIAEEKQKLIKEGELKLDKKATSIFNREGHWYELIGKKEVCVDDILPFDIPNNWSWERFGNIVINRDAERIPLSVAERAKLDKKYDYYGASGVIDKVDRPLFTETFILIGEDGANLLSRSTPIAFLAHGEYWVNNHAHVIDTCAGLSKEYIALYINAVDLSPYVTGTAQPKMNQEKMNSILVAVPPKNEQTRIVEKYKQMMPMVRELCTKDNQKKLKDFF